MMRSALFFALPFLASAFCQNTTLNPITGDEGEAIRQVILRYPVAIDSGNFDDLRQVFTPDAVVDYGFVFGRLNGTDEIIHSLATSTPNVTSQHMQNVMQLDRSDGGIVKAVTYIIATYFGTNSAQGQILTSYNIYNDTLQHTDEGWRITYRNVTTLGTNGFLSIFVGSLISVNTNN